MPPQTEHSEIFLLEQDGQYSGSYGGKNGRAGQSTSTNSKILINEFVGGIFISFVRKTI